MSFLNKVVLITGATTEIGAATAVYFAKSGARLSLIDTNEEHLKKIGENCEKLSKTKVFKVVTVNWSDKDVEAAVESTLKQFGRIDVVVNSVGVFGQGDILDPGLMQLFDATMTTNLRSIVSITHYVAPALIKTKGSVVNISSDSGETILGSLPYCVSKAALNHFTRSVALELASNGVRVNAILTGPVTSNVGKESDPLYKAAINASPLRHVVPAEKIVEVVAYLASDRAASVNGVTYPVDAGIALTSVLFQDQYAKFKASKVVR